MWYTYNVEPFSVTLMLLMLLVLFLGADEDAWFSGLVTSVSLDNKSGVAT